VWIRLGDLRDPQDGAARLADGDRISMLKFSTSSASQDVFYVDNIRVTSAESRP
jgi:hypothetical protein